MFSFSWKTLETGEVTNETLAYWEILSFFKAEASIGDLNLDIEVAAEWYLNDRVSEDSREAYEAEPQMIEDEMLESFGATLKQFAKDRISVLGQHYPFILGPNEELVRRELDDLTAIGGGYLSLQFYRAWLAGMIELEESDDERRAGQVRQFNIWFQKLFELLAAYAVSGHQGGVPHMTSLCRSSEQLHGMLTLMCAKVGAGQVKRYEDWSEEEKASNDGGIDCIVHRGGPGMPGDASLYLVGATVQKNRISEKIVGNDEKIRFSNFFANRPAAFQGVLVRPTDEDELTKDKCRNRDCLLYTYEQLWTGMGTRPQIPDGERQFLGMDAKTRRLLKNFAGAEFIDQFERYALPLR